MYATAISVAIGLILANFTYEAISTKKRWSVAVERSFFQIIAIIALVIALKK